MRLSVDGPGANGAHSVKDPSSEGKDSLLAQAVGSDRKGKASPLLYAISIPIAIVAPWVSVGIFARSSRGSRQAIDWRSTSGHASSGVTSRGCRYAFGSSLSAAELMQ